MGMEAIRKLKGKVEELERVWERRERWERRNNVMIRGMKAKETGLRKEVEKIMKMIGVEVIFEEMRKIGGGREDKGKMVICRLGGEAQKKEMMKEVMGTDEEIYREREEEGEKDVGRVQ